MGWEQTREWINEERSGFWHQILPSRFTSTLFGSRPELENHESVRNDARIAFNRMIDEVSTEIDRVYEESKPATDLSPLPSAAERKSDLVSELDQKLDTQTETLSKQIQKSRSSHVETIPVEGTPISQYLTKDEIEELNNLEERIKTLRVHLKTSVAVERKLPEIEKKYSRVESDLNDLATYSRYLPASEKEQLKETITDIDRGISNLLSGIQNDSLAPLHRNRIQAIVSKVEYAELLLKDYNEGHDDHPLDGYVKDECQSQSDLFTDIDEEGHDLNRQQQKAVVRNDDYNQVVAAAGTGKTVVLTFRVAYLVKEQGVNPENIACLTYTKQAMREMETRLENRFGISDVHVNTIHGFSFDIATDSLDGKAEVVTDEERMPFIRETIRNETDTDGSEFKQYYKEYLFHYDDKRIREEDFESKEEYFKARKNENYGTLRGGEVQSYAEKVIANFLFRNQVEYEHEIRAEWANSAEDKGGYYPDFYLPNYNLYIEHWGIDENATVPDWFTWDSEQYLDKLWWAREQYKGPDSPDLINTYEFEHQANRLEKVLEHRLQINGVQLDELSYTELVNNVFDYNKTEREIHSNLSAFIRNAKVFEIEPSDIELSKDDPRQYYFGQCGRILLQRYNDWLERTGQMDFSDMVTKAHEAIQSDPSEYQTQFDHVMVDEFQDVSKSQVNLIRLLTRGKAGPRLFAVGDDWQSIYSFQGSQVEYFVKFEDYFSNAKKTFLTKNYRCPETIIDAGNDLIENNENQIDKKVTAQKPLEATPKLHVVGGQNEEIYTKNVVDQAVGLIERYLGTWPGKDDGTVPGDIMVLCHYDKGAPYIDGLKNRLRNLDIPYDGKDDFYRPNHMPGEHETDFDDEAGVSMFSIHQAKGREAEHVIILHAADDSLGIPNDRSDTLLDPVKPIDTDSEPEDRRLFYVALTRAEGTLDILTRAENRTKFVEEIDDHLLIIHTLSALDTFDNERVTISVRPEKFFDEINKKKHQEGHLADCTSNRQKFVIWENSDQEHPTLKDDRLYQLTNAKLSRYNGTTEVVIDEKTDLSEQEVAEENLESNPDIVKIIKIFDDVHDKKHQDGYLRTKDGKKRRLVSWKSDEDEPDPPTFQEGKWYSLNDYQRSEFNEELQYVIRPDTDVTRRDPPEQEVVVTTVYDDIGEKLKQKGRLKIDGQELQFVIWKGCDLPSLVESKRYRICDFDYKKYSGNSEVVLHENTEIKALD